MGNFLRVVGEILDVNEGKQLPVIEADVYGLETGGYCCSIGDYYVPIDIGDVEPEKHTLVAVVFQGDRQMRGGSNPDVRAIMTAGEWHSNKKYIPRRAPDYCDIGIVKTE